MIIKVNDLELMVKKGNAKPLPKFIWIASMSSSTDCICREKQMCEIGEDCYGLAYESNPVMSKTVDRRRQDEQAIDYLVENGMADWFANELVKRNRLSRTHKLKYLRWNETGDCKTLEHLCFVDDVAEILGQKLGVYSVIYTHRKDLYQEFKNSRPQSKWLIINGSGFRADNHFQAVKEFSEEGIPCSSNCVQCFDEFGVGHCYKHTHTQGLMKYSDRTKGVMQSD